jgi:ATP-binding cassette subfamily B protein
MMGVLENPSLAAVYWEITKAHRWSLMRGAVAMLAVNLLGLVPPLVLGGLIDTFSGARGTWSPSVLATAYVAVFCIQALLRYPLRCGFVGTSVRVAAELREKYASRILRASGQSLNYYPAGDLISRSTSDLGLVEGALATGLPFLFDCSIYLVIVPAAMLSISPKLAITAFAVLPAIPLLAGILIPRISKASETAQEAFARLVSRAHENVVCAHTIRAYGLERRETLEFGVIGADYVGRDLYRARLESLFSGAVQAGTALSMSVVLGFGSWQAIGGELSPGGFITAFQYAGMMAWPLTGLTWAVLLFRKGSVGLRRFEEVLLLPEECSGGLSVPAGDGAIEVRHLAYAYGGRSSDVLSDVSLIVRPGERVALVGPLGSGKTTLLHLLSRVMEPPPGSVWLDGVDVTTIDMGAFRRRIAATAQEPFLFSGTIRENIALVAPGPDAVTRAAVAARVDGPEFDLGLDTPTGEKGTALSGGQRQRVAIARALACQSSILILDDATSALDRETEAQVFESLRRRTVLFSTHRMSLARTADRVIVLQAGRVIEQGSPQELLAAGGLFAKMDQKQSIFDSLGHA